ncbi:MAG TPA: hypothetical protein VM681_00470 [Candidatus Thermoplasmatota archaeon]|nr:hypothetical protein [Candidatus Thermoplasmatota archaeon]
MNGRAALAVGLCVAAVALSGPGLQTYAAGLLPRATDASVVAGSLAFLAADPQRVDILCRPVPVVDTDVGIVLEQKSHVATIDQVWINESVDPTGAASHQPTTLSSFGSAASQEIQVTMSQELHDCYLEIDSDHLSETNHEHYVVYTIEAVADGFRARVVVHVTVLYDYTIT